MREKIVFLSGSNLVKYTEYIEVVKRKNYEIIPVEVVSDSEDISEKKMNRSMTLKEKHGIEVCFISMEELAGIEEVAAIIPLDEIAVDNVRKLLFYRNDFKNSGIKALEICRNKFLQREHIFEYSPKYLLVNLENVEEAIALLESDRNKFFVLKPLCLDSSMDIIKINYNSKAILREMCMKHGSILLEELIVGQEFSIETIVVDKKIKFSNISETRTTEEIETSVSFVELQNTVPAVNITEFQKNKLFSANKDVLKSIDFDTGVSHAEYKITSDGKVYLMEIASRNPGAYMMLLYKMVYNPSLVELIVRAYLGKEIDSNEIKYNNRYAAEIFDVSVEESKNIKLIIENGKTNDISIDIENDIPALIKYSDEKRELKSGYDWMNCLITYL